MSKQFKGEAAHPHRVTNPANDAVQQVSESRSLEKLTYDAELLRWLLRFPLQRVADLAAMSGLSIPRTYARLTEYERDGLVTGVHIRMPESLGGRVYHLTDAGLRRLACVFGPRIWALAHRWGADDDGLVRAIPRAEAHVATQQFVLAVLASASTMLGVNGHHAHIEWAWERDHEEWCQSRVRTSKRILEQAQREQRRRLIRFDAYVRLEVFPAQGGSPSTYAIFTLYDTGFGDVRLIRQRLRMLLRCRDIFEAERPSECFPPLLLLVPDPHRARLWQAYALRLASEEWLVHPLRGGVCVVPALPLRAHASQRSQAGADSPRGMVSSMSASSRRRGSSLLDPWRASWYALDRSGTCTLTDLLRPIRREGLPHMREEHGRPALQSTDVHAGRQGDASDATIPVTSTPQQPDCCRERSLHGSQQHVTGVIPVTWDVWRNGKPGEVRRWAAWTSVQIAGRHQRVLLLLAAHPLLTPSDLSAALGLDGHTITRYLAQMARLGLVHRVAACAPDAPDVIDAPDMDIGSTASKSASGRRRSACFGDGCYALTPPGVFLLATQAGCPARRVSSTPSSSPSSSVQSTTKRRTLAPTRYDPGTAYDRDVRACRRITEHTRGVYMFFALLHRALRSNTGVMAQPPGGRVCWWETGRACMRHYRGRGSWRAIRPDGAAEVIVGERKVAFWLEWDRGTMGQRDLCAKFTAYSEYVQSREWHTDGNFPLPYLLIVTSEAAQETRICAALERCSGSRNALRVFIAGHRQLIECGPLEAIWRQWLPNGTYQNAQTRNWRLGAPVRIFTLHEAALA